MIFSVSDFLYLRHESKCPNFISHSKKKTSSLERRKGFARSSSCFIWMAKLLKSRVPVRVRVGRVCALYNRTFKSNTVSCLIVCCSDIRLASIDRCLGQPYNHKHVALAPFLNVFSIWANCVLISTECTVPPNFKLLKIRYIFFDFVKGCFFCVF